MATIVLPGKLQQLKNNLPKKRKERAHSCDRVGLNKSNNSDFNVESVRKNMIKMAKEKKQILEESHVPNKQANLPPSKVKPPSKNKPKVISSKIIDEDKPQKIMGYKEYLEKIS